MAYRLPQRGENLTRETSPGGVRLPKGVQVAEISPQQRTDLDRHLDTKIGDLAKKAGKFAPWPFSGWTLREGLQSSLTRNDILKELEPALKAQGVTVKELDDAVAGKPLPAPKAPEKPAETPKAPGVPLPPSTPKPAPAATAAPPAPASAPAPAPSPTPAPAPAPAPAASAAAPPPAASGGGGGGGAGTSRMDAYKRGIAGIESKGAGDYNALGKVLANGDQALGKYQIMQSNLPQWSKDALGQPITREQFLKSPELQDKIFEHRFGQYVQKYGEEGAARAWYAGEKGMKNLGKTDVHGRLTVADYGKQFAGSLGKDGETKLAGPVSELPKEPKSRNFAGVPSDAGITSEGQPTTDVRPGIVKPDSGVYSDAGITSEGAATSEPPPMPDMGGGGGIGGGALDAGKDFAGGGGDAGGGFDFGKAFGGFGEEIGKAAENMGKMAGNANASRGQNPYVVGAGQMSQPGGPIPIIDPRMVEAQKQQLAMAMQRLNAGKLF